MSKYMNINLLFILFLCQKYTFETIDNTLTKTIYLSNSKLLIENNNKIIENNEKYKNFIFYKIDLSEIEDFDDNKKYSFIRINIRLKNENIFSPFQIYLNKTLSDFMKINDEKELFMVDYNLNEKNPTIFL